MAGVLVRTGAVAGPAASDRAPGSTFFVIGQAERGPTDAPVRVTSGTEFRRLFGGRTTYSTLDAQLRTFFEEGGGRAVVLRIVGPAATIGALSTPLQDRGSTPAPTLSVKATSAGAWSSRVSVQVLDGPTTGVFRIKVLVDGVVLEDFANLHSPAEAVSVINTSARASAYIRLTDAGSAAAAPANNPAVVGPLTLTAGGDDRASINTASYLAGLALFDDTYGDGAIAIPGLGSAVHDALIEHADAHNRIALLSSERGTDAADLLAQAAAANAPRAGLFGPWIRVPDGAGGYTTVSPEGFVAAARSRAHNETGPWRAAAGEIAKARYVLGTDQVFTVSDAADLEAGKVNVLATVAASVRVYGWRSLSDDPANWMFLSAADLVNRLSVAAKTLLEPYVFAPIDDKGHLLSSIAAALEGLVKPLAAAGALYAYSERDEASGAVTQRDPGYRVSVSGDLNTAASLAGNAVYAQLGVRPAPTAALVVLDITKAGVLAAL
jgi:phage tail sheath protein FI